MHWGLECALMSLGTVLGQRSVPLPYPQVKTLLKFLCDIVYGNRLLISCEFPQLIPFDSSRGWCNSHANMNNSTLDHVLRAPQIFPTSNHIWSSSLISSIERLMAWKSLSLREVFRSRSNKRINRDYVWIPQKGGQNSKTILPLIINVAIANHSETWILIDDESLWDLTYLRIFKKLGLHMWYLKPCEGKNFLAFSDSSNRPCGTIDLMFSFGEGRNKRIMNVFFFMIPLENFYI